MRSYELKQFILCNIIEDNSQLNDVTKIILFYKTEKNKTKKIIVSKDFSLNKVPSFPDGKEFPQ
jgi:hypothetical protein